MNATPFFNLNFLSKFCDFFIMFFGRSKKYSQFLAEFRFADFFYQKFSGFCQNAFANLSRSFHGPFRIGTSSVGRSMRPGAPFLCSSLARPVQRPLSATSEETAADQAGRRRTPPSVAGGRSRPTRGLKRRMNY